MATEKERRAKSCAPICGAAANANEAANARSRAALKMVSNFLTNGKDREKQPLLVVRPDPAANGGIGMRIHWN